MIADSRFSKLPKAFWASVRTISQEIGYTNRGEGQVKVPSFDEICRAYQALKLNISSLGSKESPSSLASNLIDYYEHRAKVLNKFVEPRLMDVDRARAIYEDYHAKYKDIIKCPIPMNKQKGAMKAPAYLTALINMIIEINSGGMSCDYDPRELTTVTRDGAPLRTLARRVDGAFPGPVNPVSIWEIKEYYYTTTFGSRVADGVYESLLDGMELEELHEHEGIKVLHYLMVDARYTWWDCGKSYLCRLIDMLHMGYVDEILFGYEVVERLPDIVKEWVYIMRQRSTSL